MQDYEKRLRRVAQVQVVIRSNKKIKSSLPADMCRLEGELVLQAVEAQDQVILLDNNGQMYSSEGFAEFLQAKMNRSVKNLVFVVGGAYGFSDEVKRRAQGTFSLSRMTFTHQMVRVIFLEQLYRAFTILRNEPYHH